MEMTYAALAKSLGISLKSTSASSSTAITNAGSAHVLVPTLVSDFTSLTVEKAEEGEPPPAPDVAVSEKKEQEREEDGREVKQSPGATMIPASPVPLVVEKLEEEVRKRLSSEARDDSDATDADAEGESDSDIASSRPCSPIATVSRPPTQDSSQEENSTMETMESQSTEPTSVSEDTNVDEDEGRDPKEEAVPASETSSSSQYDPVERKIISDEQLHQAKVLVLDLLGWGVPPEYLLQRGISHALLYTVFTDLRLRLPDNIWADCIKLVSAQS